MTGTKQEKGATPAAVELRDDALDRVAGGASTGPGGNAVPTGAAPDAIRGDRDVKPRT